MVLMAASWSYPPMTTLAADRILPIERARWLSCFQLRPDVPPNGDEHDARHSRKVVLMENGMQMCFKQDMYKCG